MFNIPNSQNFEFNYLAVDLFPHYESLVNAYQDDGFGNGYYAPVDNDPFVRVFFAENDYLLTWDDVYAQFIEEQ